MVKKLRKWSSSRRKLSGKFTTFCHPCSEAHFQSADSLIFAGFKSAKLFGHGLLSFVQNIFEA